MRQVAGLVAHFTSGGRVRGTGDLTHPNPGMSNLPLTRLSPIPFPYLVYRSNTRSFMPASSSMDMASSSGYGFW